MIPQPELPFAVAVDELSAPSCTLCGQPRRWIHKRQTFAPYCGGKSCDSDQRICQQCGATYTKGIDGAGVKYCSAQCLQDRHRYKQRIGPVCLWCGVRSEYKNIRPETYVCAECTAPISGVLTRLRMHHVPLEMWRALAADPTCPLCGVDIVAIRRNSDGKYRALLAVDHDHGCCPGVASCGRCVRGLLCGTCNSMLGLGHDNPEVLENAAAYLRSVRLRDEMRDR